MVPLDERHVGVFVVDVSGHGVPAALLSVTVSRLLSRTTDGCPLVRRGSNGSSALEIVPPAEVASELANRFPFDPETRQYFTCVYGVLDCQTGEFRYVCAGHPGPVHLPKGRPPVRLQHAGRPIGLLPAALAAVGYADHSVTLAPGDRIYLFTDGIPEAANPSEEEFGFERLQETFCASRADSLQASVDTLVARVEAWCGRTGVADDVSVLAIEF